MGQSQRQQKEKPVYPNFKKMAWTVAVEKETKQEGEKHPKEAQHTGVTKRAQNPAQEHNTKDTKTHYTKGREKPPNCTKITTKRAMGVRQETYKRKTQNQNSKGWRRWAEQHTQTDQKESKKESQSPRSTYHLQQQQLLPKIAKNQNWTQKSPNCSYMEIRKSGRGEKLVASVWTQSSSKCTPRNVTHFLAKIQKALPSSYWHGKTKQTLCGLNGEGLDSILGFWIFCSSHLYFMQVCFFGCFAVWHKTFAP